MIHRRPSRPSKRDLVALADGSLHVSRRADVERMVAGCPELQADLAAQRRALGAVRGAAGEAAPAALRARLASTPVRQARRRAPRFALGTTAALAAAAILVAALLDGPTGAPTVAQAAVLGTRPAQGPTAEPRTGEVLLPRIRGAGLPFPYWEDKFGFTADGVRRDRLDGRSATTVFYIRDGEQIAYTIVAGPRLAFGHRVDRMLRGGIRLSSLRVNGRIIVTWVRGGHTCVLSAGDVSSTSLARLASWRGVGRIPY